VVISVSSHEGGGAVEVVGATVGGAVGGGVGAGVRAAPVAQSFQPFFWVLESAAHVMVPVAWSEDGGDIALRRPEYLVEPIVSLSKFPSVLKSATRTATPGGAVNAHCELAGYLPG